MLIADILEQCIKGCGILSSFLQISVLTWDFDFCVSSFTRSADCCFFFIKGNVACDVYREGQHKSCIMLSLDNKNWCRIKVMHRPWAGLLHKNWFHLVSKHFVFFPFSQNICRWTPVCPNVLNARNIWYLLHCSDFCFLPHLIPCRDVKHTARESDPASRALWSGWQALRTVKGVGPCI